MKDPATASHRRSPTAGCAGVPRDRAALRVIATIATPDTLLRWHRQLIAQQWTSASKKNLASVEVPPSFLRLPS
jgi:hypothetical protein